MLRPSELAAPGRAADLLSEVLSDTTKPLTIACIRVESIDDIVRDAAPTILVTNLLDDAEALETPWNEVEARLWARYRALADIPGMTAYICTVFRHVPPAPDRRALEARRLRIRRLNLLAADLSRETGALVIDFDRAFADIGAHTLRTDYRLGGPAALEFAASMIAGTILTTALDEVVPLEALRTAGLRLASRNADAPAASGATASASIVRAGGRTQTVEWAGAGDRRAAAYVSQVLAGKTTFDDALRRLTRAVARHGLGYSAGVVLSGVRQVVKTTFRAGG